MAEARPAKDLKPTGARAKFLIEGKQRQLRKSAQEMRKKAKAQAKDKQPRPAKDIEKGSARERILKDSRAGKIKAKPPVATGSSASSLVRTGVARLIGAVGAIVDPSFMSYKTGGQAGPGSDKSVQSLKKKYAQPIGPERPKIGSRRVYTSPVGPFKPTGGGPERRQGSSSPSMGVKRSDSYFGDVPSYKGTQKAKTFKEKNLAANQKAGKDAKKTAKASAAAPRKAKGMTFQEAVRRNRTEEYERAKFRPKKSILSLFKKKGNK
jgi:hypothetical protein